MDRGIDMPDKPIEIEVALLKQSVERHSDELNRFGVKLDSIDKKVSNHLTSVNARQAKMWGGIVVLLLGVLADLIIRFISLIR